MKKMVTGKCLCGAVQFEVVLPHKFCVHCHCSQCSRAHGAAYVTWIGVPSSQFKIVSGTDHLKWYSSSKEVKRGFCDTCGSTMFFESTRWAGEIHITLANLQKTEITPTGHVFYDDRAGWVEISDSLPRYGGKSGTEAIE